MAARTCKYIFFPGCDGYATSVTAQEEVPVWSARFAKMVNESFAFLTVKLSVPRSELPCERCRRVTATTGSSTVVV